MARPAQHVIHGVIPGNVHVIVRIPNFHHIPCMVQGLAAHDFAGQPQLMCQIQERERVSLADGGTIDQHVVCCMF